MGAKNLFSEASNGSMDYLSRNHAVGQASRLSLTLNNRPEAVFLKLVGSHQKMKGNF
jgi:hypothetical protein